MTKFSVKKPLTVFVAVVVVLVLGFVSYTKMTPDLMPNLDMPYVIVTTAYPGASPEKVETAVSKPLEKSLGLLENVENITSSSNENYSMIMIEFSSDVNMDTVTVDILQKSDAVAATFTDDKIGTPSIMKINPSMMPVQVASVDVKGMNSVELSKFVNDNVLDKLDAIEGVANVTTSGLIEQTVNVDLSDKKIEAVNKSVQAALNGTFDDKESDLDDAKSNIASGKDKITSGKDEIAQAQAQLVNKTASAKTQLDQKEIELLEGKIEIKQTIQTLQEKLVSLQEQETALIKMNESVKELESSKASLENVIDLLTKIKEQYTIAQNIVVNYEAQIETINNNSSLTSEEKQSQIAEINKNEEYIKAKSTLAQFDAQLKAQGLTFDTIGTAIEKYNLALTQVNAGLDSIDSSLKQQGYSRDDLSTALTEIAKGKKQLQTTIDNLNTTLGNLEKGQTGISSALEQLDVQKTNGVLQFSSTTSSLLTGEASLSSAESQIEAGYTSFKEAKKTALNGADMTKVITMDMVSNILMAQNFTMPAGYAIDGNDEYTISVGDQFSSIDEIENLLLVDLGIDGVDPIYLSDVANVSMKDNSDEVYAKINGNNGILLALQKQSTYSTATVSNNITETFEELKDEYDNLEFTPFMDQGEYIYMIINSLMQSLGFGILFAAIILFLFLKDLRPTIITLCSIPISLLFALTLMYFSGITLNMISLSGLAISVGMLVDNSVVVIENIYRLRGKGVSAIKSAVSGATQVFGAIAASTLTTICVFLPIVFVEGITRQLFVDMALTIAYSLIASLIIAVTLVPSMAGRMFKNTKPKKVKLLDKVIKVYDKAIRGTLKHKALVLIAAVILLITSCGLSIAKGFSFMPEMETGEITATLTMPKGSKLEDAKKASNKILKKINTVDSIDSVGAMLSSSGGMSFSSGATGANDMSFYILLKDDTKESSVEISEKLNKLCKNSGGEFNAQASGATSSMSSLTGSGVSIKVYGNDLDELQQSAKDIAKIVEKVKGIKEVSNGINETNPSIKFVVDKNKAMKKGLTVAQVYTNLSSKLTTSKSATTVTFDSNDYSVEVTNNSQDKVELSDIENYVIKFTDAQNNEKKVKLKDIADMKQTESLNTINRENQKRVLTVTAEVKEGYNVTLVNDDVEKAVVKYDTPKDVSYEFSGESESIMDSMIDLLKMMGLGILLVYLIMVAQFQSLKSPFIVMFTIPLALTGGLFALLICGKDVSVISMMGFVILCGIIVNNGIVLVDYINQLRESGMEKKEAIIEAGKTRLRPILMTSLTTILGLIVMAIGIGNGTDMMQPIAIVCIGGLLYATILTLFIVPAIYDILNKKDIVVISDEELEAIDD